MNEELKEEIINLNKKLIEQKRYSSLVRRIGAN